jgi:hypothetical protein
MQIIFYCLLLITNILLVAMDEPVLSPKSTPQGMQLREMVIAYLQANESKQAAAEPVKDSNYYKKELSSSFRNLVNTPPGLIRNEVLAGPLCLKENRGVLCAAHMIFLINIMQNTILKTINIPSRMEASDTHRPTPCVVDYAKIDGMDDEQIFLGELDGRISIANPTSYEIKTFGHVPGRVLGFFVDPIGEKIAVKYESKDAAGKTIPCFALAAAYSFKTSVLNMSAKCLASNLAQSALNKHRSWAPPLSASGKSKPWSSFAVQSCSHEVTHIAFEEDHCITYCATGNIEKWTLKNIDTNPELVKVAQIERRKP